MACMICVCHYLVLTFRAKLWIEECDYVVEIVIPCQRVDIVNTFICAGMTNVCLLIILLDYKKKVKREDLVASGFHGLHMPLI